MKTIFVFLISTATMGTMISCRMDESQHFDPKAEAGEVVSASAYHRGPDSTEVKKPPRRDYDYWRPGQ